MASNTEAQVEHTKRDTQEMTCKAFPGRIQIKHDEMQKIMDDEAKKREDTRKVPDRATKNREEQNKQLGDTRLGIQRPKRDSRPTENFCTNFQHRLRRRGLLCDYLCLDRMADDLDGIDDGPWKGDLKLDHEACTDPRYRDQYGPLFKLRYGIGLEDVDGIMEEPVMLEVTNQRGTLHSIRCHAERQDMPVLTSSMREAISRNAVEASRSREDERSTNGVPART